MEHTGNVIRRYEDLVAKFSALFGQIADVRGDQKENLLTRISKAYDTQISTLQRKAWGNTFFLGLGGAAGLAAGPLSNGPWKNVFDIGAKLFPQIGGVVSATCDATQMSGQKEMQLAQAAITSLDASSNIHQQTLQTYNTAMDRLRSIKDQARGG